MVGFWVLDCNDEAIAFVTEIAMREGEDGEGWDICGLKENGEWMVLGCYANTPELHEGMRRFAARVGALSIEK